MEERVLEIVILQYKEILLIYPSSALHQICGYRFNDSEISLLYCLENPKIMTPADFEHLAIKLDDLVGKTIKIFKIYKV